MRIGRFELNPFCSVTDELINLGVDDFDNAEVMAAMNVFREAIALKYDVDIDDLFCFLHMEKDAAYLVIDDVISSYSDNCNTFDIGQPSTAIKIELTPFERVMLFEFAVYALREEWREAEDKQR